MAPTAAVEPGWLMPMIMCFRMGFSPQTPPLHISGKSLTGDIPVRVDQRYIMLIETYDLRSTRGETPFCISRIPSPVSMKAVSQLPGLLIRGSYPLEMILWQPLAQSPLLWMQITQASCSTVQVGLHTLKLDN